MHGLPAQSWLAPSLSTYSQDQVQDTGLLTFAASFPAPLVSSCCYHHDALPVRSFAAQPRALSQLSILLQYLAPEATPRVRSAMGGAHLAQHCSMLRPLAWLLSSACRCSPALAAFCKGRACSGPLHDIAVLELVGGCHCLERPLCLPLQAELLPSW